MNKILVTGGAGFIGYHLTQYLKDTDCQLICLDNLNEYYDVNLKYGRLGELGFEKDQIKYGQMIDSNCNNNVQFIQLNLEDKENIDLLFEVENFDYVIHLAAQAGVRFSLKDPYSYINSNVVGFLNILEAARNHPIKHLLYASSSSVYGLNTKAPFCESDIVDYPASLYAATKKSNELMAHTYSHLYQIPTTGLRFFTVYGPWGRPDMAYFGFTQKIHAGEPIDIYNYGEMRRDFTYVDDIVKGIAALVEKIPDPLQIDSSRSKARYQVYNIGNNQPVELLKFVEILEKLIGKKAEKNLMPMQAGDVVETYANVDALMKDINFKPATSLEDGLKSFMDWYREYYQVGEE